ncbi:MAG: 50S ribosomal protein L30 [Promethearchaeota archaeon]
MPKRKTGENTRIAVIRLRSSIGLRQDVKETLLTLNLSRVNHAVVIDKRASYLGMLQKVKDAVTWGELDAATLTRLLQKRGRLEGNRRLTDDYITRRTKYKSIEEFAASLLAFKAELADVPKLKKVFRLHPPSKGFRGSIKLPFQNSGELGYRGSEINLLLKRMT